MGRHARIIVAYELDSDLGAMCSHQHEAHRLAHDANRPATWRVEESLEARRRTSSATSGAMPMIGARRPERR
jgi:hypothetical protein